MYTDCEIQWLDDGTSYWVTIKATDEDDVNDAGIFFYGLSRNDLVYACESGEDFYGEWKVLTVGETYN